MLSVNSCPPPLSDQIAAIKTSDPAYFVWLVNHKLIDYYSILMKSVVSEQDRFLFSIVVPVYNTEPHLLDKAVSSVIKQVYSNWELILCDDASNSSETLRLLELLPKRDSRIRVIRNRVNRGISATTNACVKLAKGKFIVLLDHDDEIYLDALLKLHGAVRNYPDATIYYSDEDFISPHGEKHHYLFKPGFSPSLLETHNYILHLVSIRKARFLEIGGMIKEYDGSQDYDLLLRLMDAGDEFVHIPDVLYSWRESATSMIGGCFKPKVFEKGKKALMDHFARIGEKIISIENNLNDIRGVYKTIYALNFDKKVLIFDRTCTCPPLGGMFADHVEICHFKGNSPILEIESLLSRQDISLIVYVENGVSSDSWKKMIYELVTHAQRKGIGMVGGWLLSQDRKLFAAGQACFDDGLLKNIVLRSPTFNSFHNRVHNVISVSHYFFAIGFDRFNEQFLKFGSLADEHHFSEVLSFRMRQLNYLNVLNPHAIAVLNGWHENVAHDILEPVQMAEPNVSMNDPYTNKNQLYQNFQYEIATVSSRPEKVGPAAQKTDYEEWISVIQRNAAAFFSSSEFSQHVRFSIIIPVYNCDILLFDILIESIRNQSYDNFEVCISDDGSTMDAVRPMLESLGDQYENFNISYLEKNRGIAENTNNAIAIAQGNYLIFVDQDDLLEPYALEGFAWAIHHSGCPEVLYSDEDKIDLDGNRFDPRLNPDWNSEMLLSHMYCPHLLCIKRVLVEDVGGMNPSMSGAQDYDLFMKVTERADRIFHLPLILYSWRVCAGSTANDPAEKIYAYEAGRCALIEALKRRGVEADVFKSPLTHLGVYRIKRKITVRDVSHIMEIKSRQDLSSLYSIKKNSGNPIEVIAVIEKTKPKLISDAESDNCVDRVVLVEDGSNLAMCYNQGVKAATAPYLVMSAADTELLSSEYPSAILEHLNRDDIGVVGIKLLYPNGLFYHTGMILGVNGVAGYAHRNLSHFAGYHNYSACIRFYSAVSGKFMGINRDRYDIVAGFDEHLSLFSDVDFCLKLKHAGYNNLYTPYVTAVLNRRVHVLEELRDPEEEMLLLKRYFDDIKNDPMYHPCLSREFEDFSINFEKSDIYEILS